MFCMAHCGGGEISTACVGACSASTVWRRVRAALRGPVAAEVRWLRGRLGKIPRVSFGRSSHRGSERSPPSWALPSMFGWRRPKPPALRLHLPLLRAGPVRKRPDNRRRLQLALLSRRPLVCANTNATERRLAIAQDRLGHQPFFSPTNKIGACARSACISRNVALRARLLGATPCQPMADGGTH